MKTLAIAMLVLAAVMANPGQSPEGDVRGAISSFAGALARNDADAIEALTGDEWLIVEGQGGIVGRERFLAALRSGSLRHDYMRYREERMIPLGEAMLWIARVDGAGHYDGRAFSFSERSSDLWVRRGDRWVCVFTQLTPIAATPG